MSTTGPGSVTTALLTTNLAQQTAASLLANLIPGVTVAKISVGGGGSSVQKVFAAQNVQLPSDIWVGAYDQGYLIGAAHAHVPNEADQVAQGILINHPQAAGPGWLIDYVRNCAVIAEIAVTSTHQKGGIGQLMLIEMHQQLLNDPLRNAKFVTAYATNASAEMMFKKSGYTVGGQHSPVPPAYQNGMQTIWDVSMFGSAPGAWAYRSIP